MRKLLRGSAVKSAVYHGEAEGETVIRFVISNAILQHFTLQIRQYLLLFR